MKLLITRITLVMILTAGLFIGMVKGQEARSKWISRMKGKLETGPDSRTAKRTADEVILDDIEMAAFHSS